jgi:hypothetical protein
MLFGGWLYPDAASNGLAAADAGFEEDKAADCAAMGTGVAQATSAPAKRQFKAFRTGIRFLRFSSQQKPIDETKFVGFG